MRNLNSAVHFQRFKLNSAPVDAVKDGGKFARAVDHTAYRERAVLDAATSAALAGDLA